MSINWEKEKVNVMSSHVGTLFNHQKEQTTSTVCDMVESERCLTKTHILNYSICVKYSEKAALYKLKINDYLC